MGVKAWIQRQRRQAQECPWLIILRMAAFFSILMVALLVMLMIITVICMDKECKNNPCNPYCDNSYRLKPDGTMMNCKDPDYDLYPPIHRHRGKREVKQEQLKPPSANSWYDNLKASAEDVGTTNCLACAGSFPKKMIVARPIGEGPNTAGDGIFPTSTFFDRQVSRNTSPLNLTTVSPLDCLLFRIQEGRRPGWAAKEEEILKHCLPKTGRKRPLVIPPEPLTMHPDAKFECLWRLQIPEFYPQASSQIFEYPDWTRHFPNDTSRCKRTWVLVGPGLETRAFLSCNSSIDPSCAHLGDYQDPTNPVAGWNRRPPGTANDSYWGFLWKSNLARSLTRPAPDVLWWCNNTLLQRLPKEWTGVCGIVTLAQNVYLSVASLPKARTRRSTTDSPAWIDSIGVPRGIPNEYKAQNEVGAGFASLIPLVQVNKNVAWINYVYYNQQRAVNSTKKALEALGDQLKATSLMAVQNRMALDMLLAEKGGVCAMFGDLCCTFIPNATAPDGAFTEALQELSNLQSEMKRNAGHMNPLEKWMTSIFGQWSGVFQTLLGVVCAVILILLIILCCILPLVKALMKKIATGTVTGVFLTMNDLHTRDTWNDDDRYEVTENGPEPFDRLVEV